MSLNIGSPPEITAPPVPKPRARYRINKAGRRLSQDRESVWYDTGASLSRDASLEENYNPLRVPSVDVPDGGDLAPVSIPHTEVPCELPISPNPQEPTEDAKQSSVVTPSSPTCPPSYVPPLSPLEPLEASAPEPEPEAQPYPEPLPEPLTELQPETVPEPVTVPEPPAEFTAPPPAPASDSSNEEEYPMTPDSLKSDEETLGGEPAEPQASCGPEGALVSRTVPDGQRFSFKMATQQPTPTPIEKQIEAQLEKQKIPRAATIRVSRKKQSPSGLARAAPPAEARPAGSVVSRSSWLDVWKGRKHNVVWATLDGQLMSLWKKRSDKFTEYVFHVSSITNVRQQGSGRFSIHFGKKHFEFMAHSEAVREGWVTSLQATRGTEPLPPPEHHGPLIMKDPRTKVYAAICGHNLWIYSKKEDFNLGIGMTCVSMNVASVKETKRHGFSLVTPYKTFNFSADSSRELGVWFNCLSQGILSALSCSEVAHRLWASPWNKVCGDCGSPNPEWASINLLLVICEDCAGQHRALGTSKSKVRSLKLDSKVWTEPLLELFVAYGNKAANDVWGYNIPAAEQILPDATTAEREAFIKDKYVKGIYRRSHPLASDRDLLEQRLCQVVCGPDVAETLSLICSGARVLCRTGEGPTALAEQAGQALQVELLRHNEFLETPTFDPLVSSKDNPGLEELHGKLDEERFLFSQENQSAACDVLDLREVIAVYDRSEGSVYEFDMLTLTDKLICNANNQETLLIHLLHILKVVLPGNVQESDVTGLLAASRVSMREGSGLQHTEAWVALRAGELLLFPTDAKRAKERLALFGDQHHNLNAADNRVEMVFGERTLSLQFEKQSSCTSWFGLLQRAMRTAPERRASQSQPLYPELCTSCDTVPPAVQKCISHITRHGLKVEGLYRRCGIAKKTSQLVEVLRSRPDSAKLETDDQGILDTGSALKQMIRDQLELIPQSHKDQWVHAAAVSHEAMRLQGYARLVRQLPAESRDTLQVLCGHLYQVQVHSQENRMTAQNLALVFVPSLFQELAMNTDMVRLTRELIIHHALVFQLSVEDPIDGVQEEQLEEEREEIITVF